MPTHSTPIPVAGFDPAGEPEILLHPDNSLHVTFAFLPPSDCEEREDYFQENFQRQMEEAIARPVRWEDRELFVIPDPHPDTAARLQRFLATYRATHPEALG